MKRQLWIKLICYAVVILTTAFGADQRDISLFKEAIELIKKNYINPFDINLSYTLNNGKISFQKTCSGQCSRDQAERKISQVLQILGDPHVRLYPSDQIDSDYGENIGSVTQDARFGFRVSLGVNQLIVTYVQPNFSAETAGIRVGDVILRVNNKENSSEKLFFEILRAESHLNPIQLLIRDIHKQEKIVKILTMIGNWKSHISEYDKDTSIISIPRLFPLNSVDLEIHEIVKKLIMGKSKNLILDLRYTDGGSPFATINIAGIFLDKIGQRYVDMTKVKITYRYENGTTFYETSEEPGKIENEPFPEPARWKGKLVILVGTDTFSMGEDLADILQHEKRAILVGEPTLGGAGVLANNFILTSGARLLLTTHRIFRLDGTPVPLKTIPDIQVPLDLDALTKGHDTQLEAAIKYLNETK